MVCGWGFYCKASPRCEMSRPSSSCSRETRSGTKAETHAERRCRMRLKFPEFKSMIRKKPAPHLTRVETGFSENIMPKQEDARAVFNAVE